MAIADSTGVAGAESRGWCSSGFLARVLPNQRVENLKRRQKEQRSILDFVLDDATAIERNLNGRDRQKLDQYLTSVREIEERIERSESMPVANPAADSPAGIPSKFEEHIALMFDMLTLAFQTDSTRVATMLLAGEGSNRTFSEIGLSEGHHNLTHHRNVQETIDKVKEIDLWYVQQLGKFLEKMEQTKDVDGQSLLHNSMIVYGSGNADGNRHTHNKPADRSRGFGRRQPQARTLREIRPHAAHEPVPEHG